jgi:hypothetical protein
MSRTRLVRRSTRWPARWPMLYGNEEFVAKGTVLDVTDKGWRMAGPMPVYPGMRRRTEGNKEGGTQCCE